jgi:siroheme synthase-like protein
MIPVTLYVSEKRCLVIGGGAVGIRKARTLYAAGAEVTLVSPSLAEPLEDIRYIQERYQELHLDTLSPFLVVAATQHESVNDQICIDSAARRILTMRVENTERGDVAGVMQREWGEIAATITSGSPLLSRYLLDKVGELATPEMQTFAHWLKVLRPHTIRLMDDQSQRAALWRRVFQSEVIAHVEAGNLAAARMALLPIIGDDLADYLPPLS